ncbi:WhiB family transcriptional regulator [Intrasporangium sp.]|uniref:WhiB family transcriptional regulator n=1 Tax=Intrasporangium sp. TaxID=1925024 RepID=UPI0032221F55
MSAERAIPGLVWVPDAPCRDDPDLFTSRGSASRAKAKAVCRTCPYQQLCLRAALAMGDQHAVMGGTDPDDRRRMRAAAVSRRQDRRTA